MKWNAILIQDVRCQIFPTSFTLFEFPWSSVAFFLAQWVKNPPAMQETEVPSLGWEDPLEEEMATCYSILAWKNPMDRRAWWVIVQSVEKSQTQEDQACMLLFLPRSVAFILILGISHHRMVSSPPARHLHSAAAAAAAKSLQSYPTLCDPIDGSPRGSPIGLRKKRKGQGEGRDQTQIPSMLSVHLIGQQYIT